MKKYDKEIAQAQLDNEKAVLKNLEKNYSDAIEEIDSKIAELMGRADADMTHVIYQVEYQKALKSQISGILAKLQANEFATVSEYLTQCYEDGFIGTLYSLQKQGVPLVFPINQEEVVAAIQHETKLSDNLYKSFDTAKLQKQIASEISRGFSTGASYKDMARNISAVSNVAKNKAVRIARTEGHRITETAAYNAQVKAKDRGADIVKIWDATLDGSTRDSHMRVDGEIRELEKKFSNGLMYPGDRNGSAAEVINCRCRSRSDARWALEADETKMLGNVSEMSDERKQQIADKLGIPVEDLQQYSGQIVPVKAKDYADFKRQYNQLWHYEGSALQAEAEARIAKLEGKGTRGKSNSGSWVKTGDLPPSINEFDDWDEYKEAMNAYNGGQRYWHNSEWENSHVYDETEMMNAKRFDATVVQIHERYPLLDDAPLVIGDYDLVQHNLNAVQRARIRDDARAQAWQNPDTGKSIIGYRPNYGAATFEDDLTWRESAIRRGEILDEVFPKSAEGTAIHEYGHLMSAYIDRGYSNGDKAAEEYWEWYKSLDRDEIAKGLSRYATTSRWEFEAECFAELQTSNPRPLAQKYGEYLERLMRTGYNGGSVEQSAVETLARKYDTSSIKTVILPRDEYAHVMSEVATHINERQKGQEVFSKAIGENIYTFENNGAANYRVIGKRPIDEESTSWWEE